MSSIAVSLEVKVEIAKFGNEAAVASVGLGNSRGVGVQSDTEGIQDLTCVGGRIRKARTAVGMSVRELARRIDVSPSHVSQVERGLAKFSVSALYRAVSALEIQFDDLFVSEPQAGDGISVVREASPQVYKQTGLDDFGVVVRAGQRRGIELRPGYRGEGGGLAPLTESGCEFLDVVYQPSASMEPPDRLIQHSGWEYGVVISGELHVQVGLGRARLQRGDSIAFDSKLPHRFWNISVHETRCIWFIRADGCALESLHHHKQGSVFVR